MGDFHLIKYRGYRLTIPQFNELHADSLGFLKKELATVKSNKNVVVTHHVPTYINYPLKYKESELNDAFAVELSDLIEATTPDYWIYGHTHDNTTDFQIGKTKLLTNQLGYVKYGEQLGFSGDRIFIL